MVSSEMFADQWRHLLYPVVRRDSEELINSVNWSDFYSKYESALWRSKNKLK